MATYKIMIGGLRPEDCHTEMETDSLQKAQAYLHVFARKSRREDAIANIGDYRTWVGNAGLDYIDLGRTRIQSLVEKMLAEEEEADRKAELWNNTFLPDIKIEPTAEGVALVTSQAMQFESHVDWKRLQSTIGELIREYQDLVEAEMVSRPVY
jgi:hypothetical protein